MGLHDSTAFFSVESLIGEISVIKAGIMMASYSLQDFECWFTLWTYLYPNILSHKDDTTSNILKKMQDRDKGQVEGSVGWHTLCLKAFPSTGVISFCVGHEIKSSALICNSEISPVSDKRVRPWVLHTLHLILSAGESAEHRALP